VVYHCYVKSSNSRTKTVSSHQLATRIGRLILEKKGTDVIIMDLKKLTSMADYFIVATADSNVQAKAMVQHLEEKLADDSIQPWHMEGLASLTWVLLDFVDVVVHIFQPYSRDFYGLERLWGDADIQELKDPDETPSLH
jgi:ribosome-associated protein